MMIALCIVCAALALLPAINTLLNVRLLKTPEMPASRPRVAILIPARNEDANIEACVRAALASEHADIEVVVLDDGSTDNTFALVEQMARNDGRLRIATAPPLPPGWRGKPHACQHLAALADSPFLLFIDADVRLLPQAAARLVPPTGVDLVSGVPRQILGGAVEAAVVPMINTLIYGYLPVALMRSRPDTSLAAACGQMIMVRASAYRECGGHAAIRTTMHDGLQLPRLFRQRGFTTDLVDGTSLATCRMYESASAVFNGFSKNAVEGMAKPLALPVWTVLLLGGHILPVVLLAFAAHLPVPAAALIAVAFAVLLLARVAQFRKCGEPWRALLLHPAGILITLIIQWNALLGAAFGRRVEWRGRTYAAD